MRENLYGEEIYMRRFKNL